IDCWNLVNPPPRWDYGPVSEPLDPWLLEHTAVIRPVPIAPITAPGGYAALPAAVPRSTRQRIETRQRFGLPESGPVIVWPTARWQLPESHDHPVLARTAARLHELLVPVFAGLGDEVVIAHVAPSPIAAASPSYRHFGQLPASEF